MSPNQYVSDLRAERDALRAKVARVEELVEAWERRSRMYADVDEPGKARELEQRANALRITLSGALPIRSGPRSTESDPAVTTRQEATQGAGDGV